MQPTFSNSFCKKTTWQGRSAWLLGNNLVEMVVLAGGGHIAEFRFRPATGLPNLNPLWTPPWKTIEPFHYDAEKHAHRYGPAITGKMIAGIAGHNLCLDYFGAPSEAEVKQGLSIHGEAPCLLWKHNRKASANSEGRLRLAVPLPVAGLGFEREIAVRPGESVAYFKERVTNLRRADHFFHWVEHVTLGPPFLDIRNSQAFISAGRGRTFPHGYEGKELLEAGRNFRWPLAQRASGGTADLSKPFCKQGRGFVVTMMLDARRDVEYFAVVNYRHRLLFGYCFHRKDFPWLAIWEENKARKDPPWRGKTQARGFEFGSTPFPVGKAEAFSRGSLFGAPGFSVVPAMGRKSVSYVSFLTPIPEGFLEVKDIRTAPREILVRGSTREGRSTTIRVPATGLASLIDSSPQ
jgi:hypothetical protein